MSKSTAWVYALGADGEVKKFSIGRLPAGGVGQCRIVEFDGAILAAGKGDVLYAMGRLPTRPGVYQGFAWPWVPRLAHSLRKLGLITEADELATLDRHNEELAERQMKTAADGFLREARRLGVLEKATELLNSLPELTYENIPNIEDHPLDPDFLMAENDRLLGMVEHWQREWERVNTDYGRVNIENTLLRGQFMKVRSRIQTAPAENGEFISRDDLLDWIDQAIISVTPEEVSAGVEKNRRVID